MDGPVETGTAEVPLGAAADIPDGTALLVPAGRTGTGAGIAVVNNGGELFAVDDTCTHAEASLAEGWAEDGAIECPLHGGVFCLRTGAVLTGPPQRPLATHGVQVRDGMVWLTPTRGPH